MVFGFSARGFTTSRADSMARIWNAELQGVRTAREEFWGRDDG
jgi:hypothetical protein